MGVRQAVEGFSLRLVSPHCGGACNDVDNLQCVGKPYESKFVLSCELHSLGYEIECERRALNVESVIYTVMGRGHSNLCEAAFNILPHFRSKILALHYHD